MSTHTIYGFVGDLAHYGAKTTYLRIKPRSGCIGASIHARERARNQSKAMKERPRSHLGRDQVVQTESSLVQTEINHISAEITVFSTEILP